MNDTMKALFGFDPDEVVREHTDALRDSLVPQLEAFDAAADELPAGVRDILRSLIVATTLNSHQVAALAARPANAPLWPGPDIYEAMRKVALDVALTEKGGER